MKSRLLVLSALLAASGAAFADGDRPSFDASASLRSRAEVRADVLAARASHQLVPAGQGGLFVAPPSTSRLTRADVVEATRVARLEGALVPAGQGPGYSVPRASQLARADVKAEVLAARAAGTLIPAGQGVTDPAVFHPTTSSRVAHALALGADRPATLSAAR